MNIASISLHWPRTLDSGVGKKLDRQIKLWQKGGHDARLFMHAAQFASPSSLVPAEVIPYNSSGPIRTELNRIKAARRLVQAVRDYNPDVIYLRLGMYVYPVHLLGHIAPLIGEANTNDQTQHRRLGIVYAIYNRLTRGFLLRNLAGLVTVSHELSEEPVFTKYCKRIQVIANGIDMKNYEPLPAPSNSTPRLAFIGNPGYTWHGVDKLVDLAYLVPEIQVDVIGYESLPGYKNLPDNFHFHGYLSAGKYKNILSEADVAVSSLGLHRIGLEEASTLKSRECLALGLPLILPYRDTDLHDLSVDFLLKIPNKEDNIHTHAGAIRDFAYRMRGRRVDRTLISDIDQGVKEIERLRFFEEVV